MTKKIQTVLTGFSIKPKADTGDLLVTITFQSQEGPGMIDELLKILGPLIKEEVIIKIEPTQLSLVDKATGEVL